MKDIYDLRGWVVPYLEVSSKDFESWGHIPSLYTCDGENHFPPIMVSWVPEEVESLVLIVDDPDAPSKTFVHLVAWNILSTWERVIIDEDTLTQAVLGKNDFGFNKWGWPCPPKWHGIHHYYFKIYWLDIDLDMYENSTKDDILTELDTNNCVVAYGELVWEYERF